MVYFPNERPNIESVEDARDWLLKELRSISREFNETTALELRTRFDIPKRPREGMIVCADGTGWNPGLGKGLYFYKNGLWVKLAEGFNSRDLLTANRTYFVRSDGSDTNDGKANTAGGAWKTLSKAASVISTFDLAGFDVTVNISDATYTTGFAPTPIGPGTITLVGNVATPANVILSVTGDNCITADNIPMCTIIVKGVELRTTTTGSGILISRRSNVQIDGIRFGAIAGIAGINILTGGRFFANSVAWTIAGNAARHISCYNSGSNAFFDSATITTAGTPAFSADFIEVAANAYVEAVGVTFGGTGATGIRFNVGTGAVIQTGAGGANYFPGNVAGIGTNFAAAPWGLYI